MIFEYNQVSIISGIRNVLSNYLLNFKIAENNNDRKGN